MSDEEEDPGKELYWASWNGEVDEVKEALSSGADPNYRDDDDNDTPLHNASISGQEVVVDILVKAGASLSAVDKNNSTPLHKASSEGHEAVVDILVKAGADPSAVDKDNDTPLHEASGSGHDAIVAILLNAGVDPSPVNKDNDTPLHMASGSGRDAVVAILLNAGVDPSPVNKDNLTPLNFACDGGHKGVVELLLKAGVDISAFDKGFKLCLACVREDVDEVKELLSSGVDLSYRGGQYNYTFLHYASASGQGAVVQLLLQEGADPAASDKYNSTPLHKASSAGHEAVVDFLLQAGANPSAVDEYNSTPLHKASSAGHEAVVNFLLQAGANPSAVDKDNDTPLHEASRAGHEAVVDFLLKAGANPSAVNKDSWTPLHNASWKGHEAVVELLLKGGADPSAAKEDGYTPLHSAALYKHKSIMELLVRYGAQLTAKDKDGRTPTDILRDETIVAYAEAEKQRHKEIGQGVNEVTGKMKVARVLLHGPPRVGKTSVKRLILNQSPRREDSTGLVVDPVRAICTSKLVAVDQTRLEELNEEKMIAMIQQEIHRKITESKKKKQKLHRNSSSHDVKPCSHDSTPTADINPPSDDSDGAVPVPSESVDSAASSTKQQSAKVLSRIAGGLSFLKSEMPSLFQCNHVHLIDSGGQPQFSNLLPLVLQSQSYHHLVVINLSEKLHDKPNNCFEIGGVKHVFPESLMLTNYQLIERACQLASGSESHVLVIGTHLDCQNEDESLAEKNEMLAPLMKKYEYNLICTDDGQPIFGVNAMLDEGQERTECANTLQEVILSAPVLVDEAKDGDQGIEADEEGLSVPLRWVVLELELSRRSKGVGVIDREEIEEVAESLEVHDLDDALAFFKKLAVYYHYPEVLPNKVFTSVAPISSRLSNIVEAAFPVKRRAGPRDRDQDRLQKTGEMTRTYLKKLSPKLKADERFSVQEFVDLMKHLRVLFSIDNDTFLFPSLLPAEAQDCDNGYHQEPLVCFWLNNDHEPRILPQSFFHALTVELLRRKEVVLNRKCEQSRSSFIFDYTVGVHSKYRMRLSNHSFWVELHTEAFVKHEQCEHIFSLVQSCTKAVLEQLKLTTLGALQYGLHCYAKDCKVEYPHPSECTCCHVPFVFSCLVSGEKWQETDDERLFWFRGLSTTSGPNRQNRPQLQQILALLRDKSDQWSEIGGAFGVDLHDRKSLRNDTRYSDVSRLEEVLNIWLTTTEPQSKVSWEEFEKVLKEHLQFNDVITKMSN